ncbi:MAG TPA: hypothetical protein ENN34_06055 [Deltaproteobacteria bacterium]|nr:hypothetical protein [Deltaproteobacteria bacterium]
MEKMFFIGPPIQHVATQGLHLSCRIGESTLDGRLKEISRSEFCMEVPSTRVKTCLLEMIHAPVLLEIEQVLLSGSILWYTIEGASYFIGIRVKKDHRAAWRKLLLDKSRWGFHASAGAASA